MTSRRGSVDDATALRRQRDLVTRYFADQGLEHGRIARRPVFAVTPHVSLWEVESVARPGRVGWFAIAGDLPTDDVSTRDAYTPRAAVRCLAARWRDVAAHMARGVPHPDVTIGRPGSWPELGDLLARRASILSDWTDDDAMWEADPAR